MNKGTILLLTLSTAFLFTACNDAGSSPSGTTDIGETSYEASYDNTDDTVSESIGVNENDWNEAIQTQNFDNVTFTYRATFLSGYQSTEQHVGTLKIAENGMISNGELVTDTETITSTRTMFIDTAVAIVANFDAFSYDAESSFYRANNPIVYHTTVLGYETTITAENVTVTWDENTNISHISCQMTQAFEEDGTPKTFVLDAEFTFTNYGTTTLDT